MTNTNYRILKAGGFNLGKELGAYEGPEPKPAEPVKYVQPPQVEPVIDESQRKAYESSAFRPISADGMRAKRPKTIPFSLLEPKEREELTDVLYGSGPDQEEE